MTREKWCLTLGFLGFSQSEIATAKASSIKRASNTAGVDWSNAIVTSGGGVAATIAALRRTRGPNKRPAKEQVAIRLDPEVVGALRASGPGWHKTYQWGQTRLILT